VHKNRKDTGLVFAKSCSPFSPRRTNEGTLPRQVFWLMGS